MKQELSTILEALPPAPPVEDAAAIDLQESKVSSRRCV
jgi:hypothetical protein